jgi:chloramphenicol-sensitive protein RarD
VTQSRAGLASGLAAYGLWGLFPLYWPLLEPNGPYEVLAHRIVWSALVAGVLIALRPASRRALARLDGRTRVRLAGAGVLITINWGVYIWGVNNHHVVETSLGYFITPLLSVAFGVLLLHERLRPAQWSTIGLGLLAVVVLTADLGRPPWIALILAASFGTYGLVKKQLRDVPADVGLTVEILAVLAPALVAAVAYAPPERLALLAGTGPLTIVPLLFFAGAARRLPLSTLGLLQYVAPVGQLAIGVLVQHEPLHGWRLVGFALVWLALVILSVDGLRHRGRRPVDVLEPL